MSLDTRPPLLRLYQMVQGNPTKNVFRCERALLSGVLRQHARLLEAHKDLEIRYRKTILGPVFLNGLMKLVGGGFA